MNARELDEMLLEAQTEYDEFMQEFMEEFLGDRLKMMQEVMNANAQNEQQPQLYGQVG